MSNIDNELAFGEYVSLPIRTEKTAEQKWDLLRKELEVRRNDLTEMSFRAEVVGDAEWLALILRKRQEVVAVLNRMEYLDRT